MSDIDDLNKDASPRVRLAQDGDEQFSLLNLLITLAERKKLIIGFPFVVAIVAAVITLLIPNVYTATTRILPPQSQSSATAMLAQQLGGLAGFAGGIAGIKNPNDLYVGMLRSRSVADNLIQRFDLNKLYKQELQSDTRGRLEKNTVIASGKDGIISIQVDDSDPKRAADIANAYADELSKLTKVLAVTEASMRRLFFEKQLADAKQNLIAAEMAARQALESGGIVQVEGQGRALAEMTARLRSQIAVKEVQVGAMRTYAADRNPELRVAVQELELLKRELAKAEGVAGDVHEGATTRSGNGLKSVGLLRNVKYYETMYELLAKQLELAKIDEAKDYAVVQVMDRAIEPDRKSKPKRAQIVLISALVAGVIAVLLALADSAIGNLLKNPAWAGRFSRLKFRLWN